MKQPIKWHSECLEARHLYFANMRADLTNKMAFLEAGEKEAEFYKRQIDTAKEKKLDGFDRDRFLLSPRKNGVGK